MVEPARSFVVKTVCEWEEQAHGLKLPYENAVVHVVDSKGETTLCGGQSAWGSSVDHNSIHDCDFYRLDINTPVQELCGECKGRAQARDMVTISRKKDWKGESGDDEAFNEVLVALSNGVEPE